MSNSFSIQKRLPLETYLLMGLLGFTAALFFCYLFESANVFGETNTTAIILKQHENGVYGLLMNEYVKYIEVWGTI